MARRAAAGPGFSRGAAGDRRPRCLERVIGVAARTLARSAVSPSTLRQAGVTTGAHLAAINLGLKTIPVDRRQHRDRETRLLAIAHGLIAAAEIGLKEHDRRAPDVVKTAGTGRACDGKTACVGWHGSQNARSDAAGGAADCGRAGAEGDDGEGEVSGVGVI